MATRFARINPGTTVYSTNGERLGRVAYFHRGSGERAEPHLTDETQEIEIPILPELSALFDRLDLPLTLREQMFVSGFVKVEDSRSAQERYFLPEQVERAESGGIVVRTPLAS